jgi:hypothetical protein
MATVAMSGAEDDQEKRADASAEVYRTVPFAARASALIRAFVPRTPIVRSEPGGAVKQWRTLTLIELTTVSGVTESTGGVTASPPHATAVSQSAELAIRENLTVRLIPPPSRCSPDCAVDQTNWAREGPS